MLELVKNQLYSFVKAINSFKKGDNMDEILGQIYLIFCYIEHELSNQQKCLDITANILDKITTREQKQSIIDDLIPKKHGRTEENTGTES